MDRRVWQATVHGVSKESEMTERLSLSFSHLYMTTGKTIALLAKWCLCFSIHCLGLSQLFFQGARVFLISYMHIPCIRDYYKRTVYYWYFTWHWVWETRASYRNTMNNLTCNQWKLQNYSEQRETRREHLIFTAHLGLCQSISQVISSNLTSRASCKAGTNPQGWWTVLPCFTDEDTGIQSNKLTCTE